VASPVCSAIGCGCQVDRSERFCMQKIKNKKPKKNKIRVRATLTAIPKRFLSIKNEKQR
jgi:hypothetical protein